MIAGLGSEWGENIRRVRSMLGMRKIDLARALGVSLSTVGRWERGEIRPRDDMKFRIAEALHVDARLIFPLVRGQQ